MVLHKCEAVQQRNCASSSHLGSTWIQITANLCIPAHSTLCAFHLSSKRPVLLDQSQIQPGDFILYLIVFFFFLVVVSLSWRYDRVNIKKLCLYFYSFGKTGLSVHFITIVWQLYYLYASQLAIFLVNGLIQEKCVGQKVIPRDQQVLICSLFLTALLLHLAPCLWFPIREYQCLTFLLVRE